MRALLIVAIVLPLAALGGWQGGVTLGGQTSGGQTSGGQGTPDAKPLGGGKFEPVQGKKGTYRAGQADVRITGTWSISNGPLDQFDCVELWCDNYCKANHPGACVNCDVNCADEHMLVMNGTSKFTPNAVVNAAEQFRTAAEKAGFKGNVPASKLLDEARAAYDKAVKSVTLNLNIPIPHFNKHQCTDAWRDYGYINAPIMMDLTANIVDANGANHEIGKTKVQIGWMKIPDPEPYRDYSQNWCPCGLDKNEWPGDDIYDEKGKKYLDYGSSGFIDYGPGLKLRDDSGQAINYLNGDSGATIEVAGVDMNGLQFTVTNSTMRSLWFEVGDGTEFHTSDEIQLMMIIQHLRRPIPPAPPSTCWPGITVATPNKVTFTVPAVCTEMSKAPPKPGQVFHLVRNHSAGLTNLALNIDREPLKGVWDQAKIWILTDHASLSAIQERLIFPKITPGQYLNALYDASNLGGIDPKTDPLAALRTCDLVLGGDASERATRWLITHTDPSEMAAAVGKGIPGLRADLGSPRPKFKQHVAELVVGLAESGAAPLQHAALEILAALSDDEMATLAQLNGLATLGCLITASDPAISTEAAAVAPKAIAAMKNSEMKAGYKGLLDSRQ